MEVNVYYRGKDRKLAQINVDTSQFEDTAYVGPQEVARQAVISAISSDGDGFAHPVFALVNGGGSGC